MRFDINFCTEMIFLEMCNKKLPMIKDSTVSVYWHNWDGADAEGRSFSIQSEIEGFFMKYPEQIKQDVSDLFTNIHKKFADWHFHKYNIKSSEYDIGFLKFRDADHLDFKGHLEENLPHEFNFTYDVQSTAATIEIRNRKGIKKFFYYWVIPDRPTETEDTYITVDTFKNSFETSFSVPESYKVKPIKRDYEVFLQKNGINESMINNFTENGFELLYLDPKILNNGKISKVWEIDVYANVIIYDSNENHIIMIDIEDINTFFLSNEYITPNIVKTFDDLCVQLDLCLIDYIYHDWDDEDVKIYEYPDANLF